MGTEPNVDVDGELDMSWTQDISDVYPRSNADNGETVAGTSDDDFGDMRTESIPTDIADQLDDLTEKRRAAVEAFYANPIASRDSVADAAGVSKPTVNAALSDVSIDPNWAERANRRGDNSTAARIRGRVEADGDSFDEDGDTGAAQTADPVTAVVADDDCRDALEQVRAVAATVGTITENTELDRFASMVGDIAADALDGGDE